MSNEVKVPGKQVKLPPDVLYFLEIKLLMDSIDRTSWWPPLS
jgi:hypothetical protein